MASYVPNTPAERAQMLETVGCASMDRLFDDIPASVRLKRPLNLPKGAPEMTVRREMQALAAKNKVFSTVLRGAGAYRHYIPASVKYITAKEEFVTAYTPYQAEISQGLLQSIFEYQTMICELTGMDVSNASVYDGATAAAEGVLMCQDRKRKTVLVSETVAPEILAVIRTYCAPQGVTVKTVPFQNGRTDPEALRALAGADTACLLIQQPNYFGALEDCAALGVAVHAAGGKFVMSCNPIALGLLKTPAEEGADVAVGDGQPLGMSLGFGGPYLGFMAATEKMMRKLPGRIVGETTDHDGNRAFVLTLQAREQHIRREKASSNICSNQALCAMTAAVYLATLGPEGLRQAAVACASKARYLADQLGKLPGYSLAYPTPFFHEFVTSCPDTQKALAALEEQGILGGLPLPDGNLLWCVTEVCTKEELDRTVAILKEVAEA